MLKIKEKAIGQNFKYRGFILKTFNHINEDKWDYIRCSKCSLYNNSCRKKGYDFCSAKHICAYKYRKDGKNAYFKNIEEIDI